MMIVMKETASDAEIEAVVQKIERAGARAHPSRGERVTVIGAIGDVEQDASVASLGLEGQPGVDRVVPILKPYKLASSQFRHGEPHGPRHRRAQDRRRALRAHRRPLHGRNA